MNQGFIKSGLKKEGNQTLFRTEKRTYFHFKSDIETDADIIAWHYYLKRSYILWQRAIRWQ
ncbi:MAG: hypothetical protein P8Y80_13190, partial [Acidobacteriota bacterium]